MMSTLAQLPETGYLVLAAVVLAIVALVGFGIILAWMRSFRTGLAEELNREINASKEAQSVQVKQPLQVESPPRFASLEDHQAHVRRVEEELKRERLSRKGLYERLEEQGNRLSRVEEKTDAQTLSLGNLDRKMDQVLLRLPREK